MTSSRQVRRVGESFNADEASLLEILCGGDDSQSAIAREQRAIATWNGYAHDDCECFLIRTASTEGVPLIEHDGGPFAMAEVSDRTETLGLLELWVVDGMLHSVDYMPFGYDHVALPSLADFTITLIARD